MKNFLNPTSNRILVEKIPEKDVTDSGLFLPVNREKNPTVGYVRAVGPGKFNEKTGVLIPMRLKPGQKVLFAGYGGYDVLGEHEKEFGSNLVFMFEDDVMAVIEE